MACCVVMVSLKLEWVGLDWAQDPLGSSASMLYRIWTVANQDPQPGITIAQRAGQHCPKRVRSQGTYRDTTSENKSTWNAARINGLCSIEAPTWTTSAQTHAQYTFFRDATNQRTRHATGLPIRSPAPMPRIFSGTRSATAARVHQSATRLGRPSPEPQTPPDPIPPYYTRLSTRNCRLCP